MLFSALALLLCQEPSLRWSRDVDELFWQALHQLEVEERAEDAAATLASLLDEPSVQQYRGQTGYLLAQQYRALRAAGLMEEAEALLPSIRRDIANTDMAQLAESVITLANRTHPGQDGANEELLELLLSAADRDYNYLKSVVSSYGERIVPELLMIFDRPEDYFGSGPGMNTSALKSLWMVAWQNDLDGFLEAMASRIRIRRIEYFEAIPIWTGIRSEVGESQRAFLIRLSEDPRSKVAETGVLGLLNSIPDQESIDRLTAVLNEGSILSPLVLDQAMTFDYSDEQVDRYDLIVACLESRDESIRSAARSMVFERSVALGLHYLSEAKGDQAACHRLLSASYEGSNKLTVAANDISTSAYPQRFRSLDSASNGLRKFTLPTRGIPNADGSFQSWSEWRAQQAQHADRETRELALAALLRQGEHSEVLGLLHRDGVPDDFPSLVTSLNVYHLPEVSEYLLPFLSDGPFSERAWQLLSVGEKGRTYLGRQEFEWAVSTMGEEALRQTSVGKREFFDGSDDEWVERLVSIIRSPTLPEEFRAATAHHGAQDSAEDASVCLQFGEALLEGCPYDPSWNPHVGGSLVFQNLRTIASLVLANNSSELSRERWDEFLGGLARFVYESLQGKGIERQSVDQGVIHLAVKAHKLGLPVRALLEQALSYPTWLERDRSSNSELLMLALLEGPEFFGNWVSGCVSQKIECQWDAIMKPWEPSLVSSPDLLLELKAGLEFGGIEFERDLLRSASGVYGATGVSEAPFEFLDERLPEFMSKSHTASNAITLAVARGLTSEDFVERARHAWAMPGLDDRHVLLRLIGSRYTPELVPLLLDAQVSHSTELARIADEALARYARIRDARSGWAAWERQGRDGSPIDALVAKTAADKSKVVRIAAIQSLGTLEAKEALPFLVELLEDSDQEIVAAVQAALARIHAAAEGSDE